MGYQQISAKRDMSIKRALEWAFGDECARIEHDEVAESSGGVRPGVDMIHNAVPGLFRTGKTQR